ncbi:MAG: hypothetical protein DIU68_014265 [Chloroflexota bacterium]|nr:MAG: hypothetical protein DIU68_11990 [Chloroflexota bacterium]
MASLTRQVFRVRPGEMGLVLALGLLLLLNSFALQVSDIVSVSGFLSEVGVREILVVWIVDMTLIILAASAQSFFVDRFNRVRLLRYMIVGFALIYVVLRLLFFFQAPIWLSYSLLFLLAEQQWFFFPLIFWILANDIFDFSQSKRLFPLVAALGFIGQILGFALTALVPTVLAHYNISTAELLNLNVLIYLLAYLLAGTLNRVKIRQTRQRTETWRETLMEGWGFVREVPSFRLLMLSMLMGGAAITIVEYHFLVVSTERLIEPGQFQAFYSVIRLIETVAAILLQTFFTSHIIERFGLKNTFVILPVVVAAGTTWILGLPGLMSVTAGWLVSKLTFNTVDQSARKSLQSLVPEERRGRVSMFMESYILGLSVILGSIIAGVIVIVGAVADNAQYTTAYLVVAAVLALLALALIIRMRAVYETSLFNWRLKRRQRANQVLDKLSF